MLLGWPAGVGRRDPLSRSEPRGPLAWDTTQFDRQQAPSATQLACVGLHAPSRRRGQPSVAQRPASKSCREVLRPRSPGAPRRALSIPFTAAAAARVTIRHVSSIQTGSASSLLPTTPPDRSVSSSIRLPVSVHLLPSLREATRPVLLGTCFSRMESNCMSSDCLNTIRKHRENCEDAGVMRRAASCGSGTKKKLTRKLGFPTRTHGPFSSSFSPHCCRGTEEAQ